MNQHLRREQLSNNHYISFLRNSIPLLLLVHFSLALLFILGGFAQTQWMYILSINLVQTILGLWLFLFAPQHSQPKLHCRIIPSLQTLAAVVSILLAGGYPTPFWLLLPICAFVSSILLRYSAVPYLLSLLTLLSLGFPHLLFQTERAEIAVVGAQALFTLVCGLSARNMVCLFMKERAKHKETEKALREANAKLAISVASYERRAQESALLAEFSNALQSCSTSEEAYQVMRTFLSQLFPYEKGAVYLFRISRDELEAIVDWGNFIAEGEVPAFEKDDCWALRRGQLYRLENIQLGLVCRHVRYPPQSQYVCAPLIAHGDTLGILHIQSERGDPTIPMQGNQSRIDAIASLADDITDHIALAIANQQLRETLHIQSIKDPLSGLYNRRYMEDALDREIHRAERQNYPLSVMMLDIDHFKAFNDLYGHEAGDIALSELGTYIKDHIRTSDIACRYGGEEFLIILPNTTAEIAQQRAEELCNGIRQMPIYQHGKLINYITVSIGVTTYPISGGDKDSLLTEADKALYQAKAKGRNCVVSTELIQKGTNQTSGEG